MAGATCVCVSALFYQETEEQTKSLEDLEFQKLEREINQGEEKENQSQELLREIAECQRLTVTRKVQWGGGASCECSACFTLQLLLALHHLYIYWVITNLN